MCSTFLRACPGGESKHERKRGGCQDDPGHPAAAVAAAAAASRSREQDLGHDAAVHGPGRTGPPARAAELCRTSTFCVRLFAHLKRQVGEPRTQASSLQACRAKKRTAVLLKTPRHQISIHHDPAHTKDTRAAGGGRYTHLRPAQREPEPSWSFARALSWTVRVRAA